MKFLFDLLDSFDLFDFFDFFPLHSIQKLKIMKTDIILAGVGGQGILSIAAVLGSAALTNNLYIKQAETHGMSQRGGDVQSFLRISDQPIFSEIGRAHV